MGQGPEQGIEEPILIDIHIYQDNSDWHAVWQGNFDMSAIQQVTKMMAQICAAEVAKITAQNKKENRKWQK